MRVAIVSGPRSPQPMGLELAERRLLEALCADPGEAQLDVRVVGRLRARRHARSLGARWVPARPGRLPRLASARADLVHLIGLDLPPPRRTPFVATVHDLSPLHFDDEGSLPPWLDEVAERARLLLTPSAFTAGEIQKHLGVPRERIRVFGGAPAFDARDASPLSERELEAMEITPPLVLRYGGYTKRKNVPLLLEAWAQVPEGTLVLTGPPQPERARILDEAPSLERVVVLDYVPQALLARLLRTASVLVSTSVYEGFGLPPLEALAAGTPVVALSSPFVLEVCDEAALLVDGGKRNLAGAICEVLTDVALSRRLREASSRRARAFTWPSAAGHVSLAYEDALTRRTVRCR